MNRINWTPELLVIQSILLILSKKAPEMRDGSRVPCYSPGPGTRTHLRDEAC